MTRLSQKFVGGPDCAPALFEQSISVKILYDIAACEHTERNFLLDLALARAEDRRRDIVRKTRGGLEAAARRGNLGDRPRAVDDDKRRAILARRAESQSPREISRGVGVSLAVVRRSEGRRTRHLRRTRPGSRAGSTRGDRAEVPALISANAELRWIFGEFYRDPNYSSL
ncbi:hypothetical protein [Nocardia sp. NPDC046763]|uniref:hypothetical protein n=1 Tax=Nocardia sp. NPDC046763 TaxID=3155256 RepID=UPI0033FCB6C8